MVRAFVVARRRAARVTVVIVALAGMGMASTATPVQAVGSRPCDASVIEESGGWRALRDQEIKIGAMVYARYSLGVRNYTDEDGLNRHELLRIIERHSRNTPHRPVLTVRTRFPYADRIAALYHDETSEDWQCHGAAGAGHIEAISIHGNVDKLGVPQDLLVDWLVA